jgi:hypothetical protein
MRHARQYLHPRTLITLAVLLVFVACATSGVGKAVQSSDLQKQLVEAAAVEFVKLKLGGDPRITPAVYDSGRQAYEKWASAQTTMAASLATWKTISNAPNEQKLQTALADVRKNADVYLAFVGKFVDLAKLKSQIGQ